MTNSNGHHIEQEDGDRVRPDFACPKCGESRLDYLVWIDDDRVRCSSCGTEYQPGE